MQILWIHVSLSTSSSLRQISPLVTVINPANTDRHTTNIYIGVIQEYHYMLTMPVLNFNTCEMTWNGNEMGMSQFKNQQVQINANYKNVNKDSSQEISMHSLPIETKRTVSLL